MLDFLKKLVKKDSTFSGLFTRGALSSAFNWSKGAGLSWYEKSLYLNKAINKRAQKVGQVEFILRDLKGEVVESAEATKWLNLLDKPNKYQTGRQFFSLAQKYYDITGAAFILKKGGVAGEDRIFTSGVPTELELLISDSVAVILDETQKNIVRFEYVSPGGTIENYQPEQIIYWYNPNPRYPLLGESLISSGIRAIDTEIQISEYASNVIRNGGKPEMVFSIEGVANQEELNRIEENYAEKKAKKVAKGMPLIVGGKWSVLSSGLTPAEIGYLDTKVSTLNDIVILTSVPKSLLSLTEGETFSNADASLMTFLRDTIKPQIEGLVNVLDWDLIPENFELDFIDQTPENVDQKLKTIEMANNINSLTTNEKRSLVAELTGEEFLPVKDGDDILVPFNYVALGMTKTDYTAKAKTFNPLLTKTIRDLYAKRKDSLMTRYENSMLDGVDTFFKEQHERLLNNLGETRKRKGVLDGIFNDNLEISLAKSSLLPILRQIFMDNGEDTARTFGVHFHFNSAIERSLSDRANLFSESIIQTTTDQLLLQFQQSFGNNESRQQLVNRIAELYSGISKGRASVIARTEVHAAMTRSNLEVYKQAGLKTKIWVTVGDDRVRPEHQALDGEEVPLDAYFSNGESEPSAPNCRCQI